ncbi:hypothetical protein TU94_28240 [Streptomyces cyaneogriseus subsp. noncyanogenus]|uniref:Uncharacterized protein n=1 Tax=Streptomyces cyaneogriseus subsp. noncyanogenus TaxID=477245 RepID=A0A0C5FXF5_9ACTN|nr:hypothetical protein [Streptomyces cyaneogriseus]AJP04757.1 hypothetical protein TU94_28240 [Streptomyces cyaneogriseus subsp. noncyanogenus]
MTDQTPSLDERVHAAVRDALAAAARNPAAGPAAASLIASAVLAEVHRQPTVQAPAVDRAGLREAARLVAEYTGNEIDANAQMLLRLADGTPRPDDPQPAAVLPAPVDRGAPTVWIDGHPQLEAIAAAVWEQCEHHNSGLVIDDPRNIAVAALGALRGVLPPPVDQAAIVRACASFVRDTYSGEWADDAAATLETDADQIERGEPCSLLQLADAMRLAVPPRRMADDAQPAPPQHSALVLSETERAMLTYALDQAQERIWSEDGFTVEDQAAVDSLRRLTAGARQDGAQQ